MPLINPFETVNLQKTVNENSHPPTTVDTPDFLN